MVLSHYTGSAFYNTGNNTNGFFSQQGVIFFSVSSSVALGANLADQPQLLFNAIQTLVEISTQFAQRPIVVYELQPLSALVTKIL